MTASIKETVAANIAKLRQLHNMTQLELADKLNYSDKSVSKWERGESLPDITVLMDIASLFGVTLDYLVTAEHEPTAEESIPASTIHTEERRRHLNRCFITGMSILLVWLVATLAFVICAIFSNIRYAHWLAFAYAIPVSMITWLVFNSLWFNRRRNFLIISFLMWSTLAVLCLSFTIITSINIWLVMVLGVFGQAIILLWSRLNR